MSTMTDHYLSADRPIEHLDDDRLQRRGFALSVAQAITTWHGDDSLVMALYGGWGDGKSSVKGMVVDAMKRNKDTCPFIVHFNPWEWAGQNQLAQVFFDEIGKQLAQQGNGKDKKKAEECGRRLQKLGKYLNLTGTLMTPLGYAANLAFPFASIVTDAAAKALKKSGQLAQQAAEAVQEQKEREGTELLSVKSELKAALTALNRNVVVMVDDIDRLAADEIKLLFQLVKANSDFPNLIFFLFFQRDIIERALGRTIRTGTGKDYLEKIVQVPLSLPQIQRPLLEAFMDSKLRKLLKRRRLEKYFDWSRFKEMWRQGLSGYFLNVRDAARFFGTFEFQVAAFADPAEFDPVDLFSLEVLRVFEHGVYEVVAASPHLLALDESALLQEEIRENDLTEAWNRAISRIVKEGRATRPATVATILKTLFPRESFAAKMRSTDVLDRLQKRASVGHPAFFGRYFHLCIPQGDVPQTEVLCLLSSIAKPDEFKRHLRRLDGQRLALVALTRLSAYPDEFDAANAEACAVALCDVTDECVGNYADDWWNGYAAMSCLIIEAHLDKLSTSSERFGVCKKVFERTTGIYLAAELLSRQRSRESHYAAKEAGMGLSRDQCKVLEKSQMDELGRICIATFEKAAASGALRRHSRVRDILIWWNQWSAPAVGAKEHFRELAGNDDGLLTLLSGFLGDRLSDNRQKGFIDQFFGKALCDLEQFMPPEEVLVRVKEARRSRTSESDQKTCAAFMEVYEEHVRNSGAFPVLQQRS